MRRKEGTANVWRAGRIVAVAAALVLSLPPAASADSKKTAAAIVLSQLEMLKQERALLACLKASPTRNTPCIRRSALKLSLLASRHIRSINDATDGTEIACVRTVTAQQLTILRTWRDASMALYRNQRKKAKRLMLSADRTALAQAKILPACFERVFGG